MDKLSMSSDAIIASSSSSSHQKKPFQKKIHSNNNNNNHHNNHNRHQNNSFDSNRPKFQQNKNPKAHHVVKVSNNHDDRIGSKFHQSRGGNSYTPERALKVVTIERPRVIKPDSFQPPSLGTETGTGTATASSVFERSGKSGTVVIFRNLNKTVQQSDVFELCRAVGDIKQVHLQHEGGFGVARALFNNDRDAAACMAKYHGLTLDGLEMNVAIENPTPVVKSVFERLGKSGTVVIFRNLNKTVQQSDVFELCRAVGDIKQVHLQHEGGFGVARALFNNDRDAAACIAKYHGLTLDGLEMNVAIENPTPVVKSVFERLEGSDVGAVSSFIPPELVQQQNIRSGFFGQVLTLPESSFSSPRKFLHHEQDVSKKRKLSLPDHLTASPVASIAEDGDLYGCLNRDDDVIEDGDEDLYGDQLQISNIFPTFISDINAENRKIRESLDFCGMEINQSAASSFIPPELVQPQNVSTKQEEFLCSFSKNYLNLKHRNERYSLDAHRNAIPLEFEARTFGNFLPFINREEEINDYVDLIQQTYPFDCNIKCSADQFFKFPPLFISTGCPGLGKTTFARLSLEKYLELNEDSSNEKIYQVIQQTVTKRLLFQISFAVDKLQHDEFLVDGGMVNQTKANRSIAARILYEFTKYQYKDQRKPTHFESFAAFWTWMNSQSSSCDLQLSDVIQFIMTRSNATNLPLMIINLDEVNTLFSDEKSSNNTTDNLANKYLSTITKILLDETYSQRHAFLIPFITSTKTLKTQQFLQISGYAPKIIGLSLLSDIHGLDLIRNVVSRCFESGVNEEREKLLQKISNSKNIFILIRLMGGNPRFFELLLSSIGLSDRQKFSRKRFVANIESISSNQDVNIDNNLQICLENIKKNILARYPKFMLKINKISEITPVLTAMTLFDDFPVDRDNKITKSCDYTIEELEQDGIVFLSTNDRGLLRLRLPFLWIHVIVEEFFLSKRHIMPIIPILNYIKLQLTPDDFENLCVSVIVLKAQAYQSYVGKDAITLRYLIGRHLDNLALPNSIRIIPQDKQGDAEYFEIRKLQSKIETRKTWKKFYGENRHQFLAALNGDKASGPDALILSVPSLRLQMKQRITARRKEFAGATVPTENLLSPQFLEEKEKASFKSTDKEEDPIFIYITDNATDSEQKREEERKRCIVIDCEDRIAFFGKYLGPIVAMARKTSELRYIENSK